jgi:hypothetical protein
MFVRFDLTTNTRSIEKGRVNPSPGGWGGQFVELFRLGSGKVMRRDRLVSRC